MVFLNPFGYFLSVFKNVFVMLSKKSKRNGLQIYAGARYYSGGDGGESNSPSRRNDPEYATSLVSSFILPG